MKTAIQSSLADVRENRAISGRLRFRAAIRKISAIAGPQIAALRAGVEICELEGYP
jgi:hypothetical protein